jgi:hypothetical protein
LLLKKEGGHKARLKHVIFLRKEASGNFQSGFRRQGISTGKKARGKIDH